MSTSAASQNPVATAVAIPSVMQQHFDDAADLHAIRTKLVGLAHVNLQCLIRFDERVSAHLEGLALAGDDCWSIVNAGLSRASAAAVFVATMGAIESRSRRRLSRLCSLAEADGAAQRGVLAAFGWVEPARLRGIVRELLDSSHDFLRFLGVAACAMHRVDPGKAARAVLDSTDLQLRRRVLRSHGELGTVQEIRNCIVMLATDDSESAFWAARSAVLLGNRSDALNVLTAIARGTSRFAAGAFRLALQAMGQQQAHEWLRELASANPGNKRERIVGSGLAGNPAYVPWLINEMAQNETARVAGEAFSLITGLDLAALDLAAAAPAGFESGPNDDPEDSNVDLDEDEGLPWPDGRKVRDWWHVNSGQFQPGTRYFMGQPLNRENCLKVLKEGYQRQRIAAALYLSLLNPGTPLFEWRAPARRQQRLLAEMH